MGKSAWLLLAIVFLAGSLVADVSVTAPGGGTVWTIGRQETIAWTWSNLPAAPNLRVRVLLWKDGDVLCVLASDIPLTQGQLLWTVDEASCPGLVPGTYRVRVRIIGGDAFSSVNFTIQQAADIRKPPLDKVLKPLPPVVNLLPDLAVAAHSYDPVHPKVDDTVTFRATVVNQGRGTTVPVSVVAEVVGPEGFQPFSKSFRLPPLGEEPGSNANEIHFPFVATHMGIVRIQLRLDTQNEQAEKDEDNNTREFLQGIEPPLLPDLVVCLPTLQRVQVTVGELDLRMLVRNIGHAPSAPCSLRIWLEEVKGDNVKWRNVPALDPGQSVEFAAECVWLTSGTKGVHANVDANGSVVELDEDNNKVNIGVNVYFPGEPQNWEGTIQWKCSGSQ